MLLEDGDLGSALHRLLRRHRSGGAGSDDGDVVPLHLREVRSIRGIAFSISGR